MQGRQASPNSISGSRADRPFSVLDYGVRRSKDAASTKELQNAIDDVNSRGGGTLYFPSGDYCTGSIVLKSHVCLYLDTGAALWASRNKEDFHVENTKLDTPNAMLISADGAEHIAICGRGILNGNQPGELGVRIDTGVLADFRWKTIRFTDCRYVNITGVTMLDMDGWTVGLHRCDFVFIDNVSIHSNYRRTNTDGIQIASCKDVHVSNCSLSMGDDAIAMFASKAKACELVTVTNCSMESASSGIKIGGTYQNFRDITVSNCVMHNCMVGIGFYTKGEGCAERISFSNITIGTIDDLSQVNEVIRNQIVPLLIDIDSRSNAPALAVLRDISFANIAIDSEWGNLIQGTDDNPVRHLTMRDITFRVRAESDYATRKKPWGYWMNDPETEANRATVYARKPSYFTFANVDTLFMDHIEVIIPDDAFKKYPRTAVSLHRVNNAVLRSVSRMPHGDAQADVVVADKACRSVRISP